jgi:hypothetical protein
MLVTIHDFALNGLMRCDMLSANPASSYSREEDHGDRKHHAEEEREWNVCVVALSPKQAIATEDAPEEARKRFPGPEILGNAFVLVAEQHGAKRKNRRAPRRQAGRGGLSRALARLFPVELQSFQDGHISCGK